MSRLPSVYPNEFERFVRPYFFVGERFFDTKKLAKSVAKAVRKRYKVPCKTIVIPESWSLNGYEERYLVMLPTEIVGIGNEIDRAVIFIQQHPGGWP